MAGEIIADVLKFVQNWAALGGAAAALLVLFGGRGPLAALGRWRDRVVKAALYPLLAEERARARFEKFERAMDAVLAEITTNGGSSLKDAVNRIEDGLIRQGGRINLLLTMDDAAAVFETDGAGLCIWVSPAHQRLTGRPMDEVMGWGWIAAIHEDDADHVRQSWRSAVEDRRAFISRFRIVRPDGTVVSVHSAANTLRAGARVVGWVGMMTVIDEVEAAEMTR